MIKTSSLRHECRAAAGPAAAQTKSGFKIVEPAAAASDGRNGTEKKGWLPDGGLALKDDEVGVNRELPDSETMRVPEKNFESLDDDMRGGFREDRESPDGKMRPGPESSHDDDVLMSDPNYQRSVPISPVTRRVGVCILHRTEQ